MSWLKEAASGEPLPTFKEDPNELKVKDPSIPNRLVSNKPANRPFLAYAEYRGKQEKLHQDWVKKKEERDAAIARGEEVGPLEPDPTAVEEVGVLGLLKFLVICLVIGALAGKFVTGSYTWDYQSKWLTLKQYMPRNERLFSEVYLAKFNGEDPGKPIYISIDGEVYDVSAGSSYKRGGSYDILAGREGARAFATGCFKEHMTHDTRGLDEEERQGLEHWKNFYNNHPKYWKVGRLALQPIDPKSPIPEHCDPKKRAADAEKRQKQEEQRQRNAELVAIERAKKEKEEGHSEL
ncbi:cytochrome b5 [Coprinopsis marcescibilis]|uniref:Cytochrome b5 n=1 Tax=Coprinopsis marcescibilis TaxID=230819 RepID=A0A5C3L9D5_COPMA|nr:cytochrome b5 [Coprinopsis marcescibilis]